MLFTGDELVLALISLVRATHPRMLRQEADGFSVDFETLAGMKELGPDEHLLLKMRAVLDAPPPDSAPAHTGGSHSSAESAPPAGSTPVSSPDGASLTLDLTPAEAQRLARTLARLESLQRWPDDVLEMSRGLRGRLLKASKV